MQDIAPLTLFLVGAQNPSLSLYHCPNPLLKAAGHSTLNPPSWCLKLVLGPPIPKHGLNPAPQSCKNSNFQNPGIAKKDTTILCSPTLRPDHLFSPNDGPNPTPSN